MSFGNSDINVFGYDGRSGNGAGHTHDMEMNFVYTLIYGNALIYFDGRDFLSYPILYPDSYLP